MIRRQSRGVRISLGLPRVSVETAKPEAKTLKALAFKQNCYPVKAQAQNLERARTPNLNPCFRRFFSSCVKISRPPKAHLPKPVGPNNFPSPGTQRMRCAAKRGKSTRRRGLPTRKSQVQVLIRRLSGSDIVRCMQFGVGSVRFRKPRNPLGFKCRFQKFRSTGFRLKAEGHHSSGLSGCWLRFFLGS